PTPTPTATVVAKPKFSVSRAAKRSARFRVTCATRCVVRATLTVNKRTARRLHLHGSRRVGSLKRTLRAGTRTVKVRLTKKARRYFARAHRRSFRATLRVSAGGAKTSRRVRIRR
ncbi:MAG TPA: hypothetical protein VFG79_16380, partial [Solirubrobacter sp.]|nr:hypothetical protein [Solirubrobacter sp.]